MKTSKLKNIQRKFLEEELLPFINEGAYQVLWEMVNGKGDILPKLYKVETKDNYFEVLTSISIKKAIEHVLLHGRYSRADKGMIECMIREYKRKKSKLK